MRLVRASSLSAGPGVASFPAKAWDLRGIRGGREELENSSWSSAVGGGYGGAKTLVAMRIAWCRLVVVAGLD